MLIESLDGGDIVSKYTDITSIRSRNRVAVDNAPTTMIVDEMELRSIWGKHSSLARNINQACVLPGADIGNNMGSKGPLGCCVFGEVGGVVLLLLFSVLIGDAS